MTDSYPPHQDLPSQNGDPIEPDPNDPFANVGEEDVQPVQAAPAPTSAEPADGAAPSRVAPNRTRASARVPSQPHQLRFPMFYSIQSVVLIAVIVATLLTLWTPSNLFSDQLLARMLQSVQTQELTPEPLAAAPTSAVVKPRIGIVSGHWGNDSGSVCPDGVTEEKVNLRIATLVQQYLVSEGYEVDLLQEFDEKLKAYQAMTLVSIHNDSCDYINDSATGFKVAAAASTVYPEKANRLEQCLIDRYAATTGLPYHANTITTDMTSYHAFQEIDPNTTAAIIETGFLNLDRQILTEKPDLVARGVTSGILCFVRNEAVTQTQPAEEPTTLPTE
jgi:N-acetylmuramoyl-L-alanine amidase